ncbi:MAG: acyl-CoA dehydrogenase family protein [Acidimicrobiia bacterium]|nr:MAG: acyl-CoA dehydrogenase family protein [Acidimicrobiia bacterium]
MPTHEVTNQPPELGAYNVYESDPVLPEAVARYGAGWAEEQLTEFGSVVGELEVREWSRLANENLPILHTHDRFGNRSDTVEFHPSWHALMELSVRNGVPSIHRETGARQGSHIARAALMFLDSQMEQGHGCPISMTSSVTATLKLQPDIINELQPLLTSRRYDRSFAPMADKTGILLGMGMTEKQGGSDVRANTTVAEPIEAGGPGSEYLLTGHKWFMSAPMCDGFAVLAQAPGGLSCFYLPRWTPDGEVNRFFIQRLKDKLGNRSNASSEVEFDKAWARMVGDEGRGVKTIIAMVNGTRLDCTIGSTAIMRQAVTQATHHISHRSAFGDLLVDTPIMQAVIADLEIETEAATLLTMRLAETFDRADEDAASALLQRIMTPVAKYWVTKRCSAVVYEALECLGGNGFVEESTMPRLFRESPLNAIWEGSGNVIALDLMRAMKREPEAVDIFVDEIELARGADLRLDAAIDRLKKTLGSDVSEAELRRLIEEMAIVLEGSLVVRHGSQALADGFVTTRIDGDWGRTFGTIPQSTETDSLVAASVVE